VKRHIFFDGIREAFKTSEGFSVIFHLTSGACINASIMEPYWHQLSRFEGTTIPDGNPVVIDADSVQAYEIEE